MRFFIHNGGTVQTPDIIDPTISIMLSDSAEVDWAHYMGAIRWNMDKIFQKHEDDGGYLYWHKKYLNG